MARRFRRLLTASLMALLSACGGGFVWTSGSLHAGGLWIVAPTDSGRFDTSSSWIVVEGRAFAPPGSSCPASIAPGYSVTWTNLATGASATANLSLGCLVQVDILWSTSPISLAIGTNTITVTARDSEGRTASDTLWVTRVGN